jgi:NAD(P)-dependent dehydrogenase (short-subunit alcohol dehydrogenase family)
MGKLQGMVAIITGSGQGLGLAMATALTEAGARLVLVELREKRLQTAADALRDTGAQVVALCGDVRERQTADNAVVQALDAFGQLDILINCAQWLAMPVPFIEQGQEHFANMIDSGLYGTVNFMQAAYPALKRQGGSVINMASGAGTGGNFGQAAYGATKEAIRGLTRTVAKEWGTDRIRINVICPAAVSPSMNSWFKDKPDELATTLKLNALGRFAEGTDIGSLVVFLASPDCFLTGQTLHCDGGQVMP